MLKLKIDPRTYIYDYYALMPNIKYIYKGWIRKWLFFLILSLLVSCETTKKHAT